MKLSLYEEDSALIKVTVKDYPLAEILPGMKLGKEIVTDSGQVILAQHTILTEWMIERLQEWGFNSIYIHEEIKEDQNTALGEEQKYYIEEHAKILGLIDSAFQKTRNIKEVPISQINDIADCTIKNLLSLNAVISYLHLINTKDDYTFRHSLNVAVICGVIGKWLHFSEDKLRDVVLAGLLHDIGKTRIPVEILNKPAKLSTNEMSYMKQHPMLGYELVFGSKEIAAPVKMAILQHHERLDGTGYPQGLLKNDISQEGKIVAVADTYDAMTAHRIYRSALTPFLVMEELLQEMFGKLDAEICMLFINNTKDALVGSKVRLNNGAEGKIIFINKEYNIKPIIQTSEGKCIELKNEKDIEIVAFVSDIK